MGNNKFITSLKAHEGKIKNLEVKDSKVKKKSLALKSINNHEDRNGYDNDNDNDDDIVMSVKRFTKFLRNKKYGNQRIFIRHKDDKEE